MNETLELVQDIPDSDWEVLLALVNKERNVDEVQQRHEPCEVLLFLS